MSALAYEQDPSYFLDSTSASKKKKGRHRKLDTLTYETIREYFVYTQSQAAKKLGVSVSTLKRKFYSLGYENRWPYIRTVTPKKKGMNKRTHEESEEEEVSAEEEEDSYESEEEEVIREPITRSARKVASPSTLESKKRKVVVDEKQEEQGVNQTSPTSKIGFSSTSSAAFIPQISNSKPIAVEQMAEEAVEEEDDEYIASEEEEEEPIIDDEEQEPIVVVGGAHKESTIDHLNTSNISFSDMSNYAHPMSANNNNTSYTNSSTHQRLFNEQSQASNQSQDFGDEIVAASMLFQFASSDKKFSSPRILPPISSLHSTNFMNYHAQPLKKRIPSLGDYRNFNNRSTNCFNNIPSNNSPCNNGTQIASEGLILPPIKNLIRDEQCSIGFNNHQHMIQQHIS